jgi:phosphatidylglycerophosphatase C
MKLALFDFDGTITTQDSLVHFVRYAVGFKAYYVGLCYLCPALLGYVCHLVSRKNMKQRVITYFFKGMEEAELQGLAVQYTEAQIDKIVRPQAVQRIRWHQDQGHKVVVVSASIDLWLRAWCDKQGVDLIATQLEVNAGKITGNFATKNCYGPEKVRRVKERYDASKFVYSYAYGDSRGDKELLDLVAQPFYKPFRSMQHDEQALV